MEFLKQHWESLATIGAGILVAYFFYRKESAQSSATAQDAADQAALAAQQAQSQQSALQSLFGGGGGGAVLSPSNTSLGNVAQNTTTQTAQQTQVLPGQYEFNGQIYTSQQAYQAAITSFLSSQGVNLNSNAGNTSSQTGTGSGGAGTGTGSGSGSTGTQSNTGSNNTSITASNTPGAGLPPGNVVTGGFASSNSPAVGSIVVASGAQPAQQVAMATASTPGTMPQNSPTINPTVNPYVSSSRLENQVIRR